jgi:DNA-binding transcriptional LysR family regulator
MDVELPSLDAIKRFVERGNGVALVPRLTVEPELASGSLVAVEVSELHMDRQLRLVVRNGSPLSHAAQAFLEVVRSHAAESGAPDCFEEDRRSARRGSVSAGN